ncbi:MAG: aldo/keto reductase, partial [Anaerolineaceae bacterium]|nr:aldo/keto reductase [Anaerolineaceae bacterium]
EMEYLPLFRDLGYGATIWSPLASGVLTGKYNAGVPEGTRASLKGYEWLRDQILNPEKLETARKLKPVADDLGCSMAQLALAWCLNNPNVSTVITGASRPEQVTENMKALEVVPLLTSELVERIDTILGNKPTFEVF